MLVDLLELARHHLPLFVLVLMRTSGLVLTGPPFGGSEIPTQVRVLLAFTLAVLIFPTQIGAHIEPPVTVAGYVPLIGGELLVGFTLGTGVMILFSGVQLAGQIIGQMSGMTLADVYSPGFDASVPVFSQLLYMVALAVFLMLGGHRLVMSGMLETFAAIGPGGASLSNSLGETVVTLLVQSFSLGIRIAAPATAALLLASLVMGIISRTLPQLNVMALGFGLNALTTFGMMSASLAGMAWLVQDEIEPMLEAVIEAVM